MPRRRLVLGSFLAFLVCAAVTSPAAAKPAGFKTSQPPAAVALAPNVVLDPILTAGDVIGNFQATGVMDGLGFYRSSNSSVELLMDHELANMTRDLNATDNFDARVTHLTLSNPGRITAAEYALNGSQGFIWFCSGNLTVLDGTPWFFTGEEDQNYFSPHGGTTIAIDATNPLAFHVLNHFGFMAHEQELPILGLDEATFVLPEDNPGTTFASGTPISNVSQLYAYTASDWSSALDGTGQLGVFVPDGTFTDGNPSTNDIHKGQSITGHFEPLDQSTDNANQQALEGAAQAAGAFDFIRLEDVVQSKTEPGVVYFADTGRIAKESVRGRVYRLALNPADPTQATLSVLLDGDAGDPIINPDNVAASPKALIIQEDRNSEHRFPAGPGSLLQPGESPYSLMYVYSFANGKLRAVVRPDTFASLIERRGQGDWETSGMTDASSLWGKGWWLFDVQMHHTSVGQPATSATMTPNTTTGENAQLLRIYIPGT